MNDSFGTKELLQIIHYIKRYECTQEQFFEIPEEEYLLNRVIIVKAKKMLGEIRKNKKKVK